MTTAERREARDDLRSEIEEIDADMIGYREDLRMAKMMIAAGKEMRAALIARRNELRTHSTEIQR